MTRTSIRGRGLGISVCSLGDQMGSLCFKVLLLSRRLQRGTLLRSRLKQGCHRVATCIRGKVTGRTSLSTIGIRRLGARRGEIRLTSLHITCLRVLSVLVNRRLSRRARLRGPIPRGSISTIDSVHQPRLSLFSTRNTKLRVRRGTLGMHRLPRFKLCIRNTCKGPKLGVLGGRFSPCCVTNIQLS